MRCSNACARTRFACLVSAVSVSLVSATYADDGGRWDPLPPLQLERQETGAARIGDIVYVSGGLVPAARLTATDTVEAFDLATSTWSSVAPMPDPRDHHGMVALNGLLYVIGGYNASFSNPRDTVWVYDPGDNAWTDAPSLPVRRGGHWAVTHSDGCIYVFGGENEARAAQDTTYKFDPTTNTWTERAPMSIAREHLTAVSVGAYIYVIGGRRGSSNNLNERYDPASDTWTTMAPMPTARSAMGVAAIGDRIFVMGGEVPRLFEMTEVYHIPTDSWTSQHDMDLPRHGLAAVAIPEQNAIMFPAGGIVQGLLPTNEADTFTPGPTFWIDGDCPGPVAAHIVGAAPGGRLVIAYAFARGNFTVPGGRPCAGVMTALDAGTVTLGAVLLADADGNASMNSDLPPVACGNAFAQVLDVQRCVMSNVVEVSP